MKKKILIPIVILLVVIIAFEVIYLFTLNTKEEEPNNPPSETEEPLNPNITVSKESILKISEEENIYVDTDFSSQILVDNINDEEVYLEIINNRLYLTKGTKQSLVSNLTEEIVYFKDAQNNCDVSKNNILILTTSGNLYMLRGYTNRSRFSEETLTKLNNNEDVLIYLDKLNSDGLKVEAFIDSHGDGRFATCGLPTQYIYASDKTVRAYDTFEEAKKYVVDYIGNNQNRGFVIYNDQTISINDADLVLNKDGTSLVIKEYYIDRNNNIYLIDANNYLYIEEYNTDSPNYSPEIKLYSEIPVNNVSRNYTGVVQINFVDTSSLNINI